MRSGYSGRSIKREMFRDVHFWHETSGGPEGFHHWTQFRKGGLKLGNSDPVTALTSEYSKDEILVIVVREPLTTRYQY